jgi:hypothetical protein
MGVINAVPTHGRHKCGPYTDILRDNADLFHVAYYITDCFRAPTGKDCEKHHNLFVI